MTPVDTKDAQLPASHDSPPAETTPSESRAPSSESPVLVKDLRKSFGEQHVLNGVDLMVAAQGTVAVLGKSGTGKSVLLKLLVGLQQPDSGEIRIFNQPIEKLKPAQLNEVRRKIGFLFQGAALYDSLTLEENVMFPLARQARIPESEQRERARKLLKDVGLEAGLSKLPSEISGGMQKRVGLARALALDPQLLLLDEPTAGLDPITSTGICKLIAELRRDRNITAVVVTHDVPGAKQFADRFVLLNEGRIVADGPWEEFSRSGDAFVAEFLAGSA